MNPVRTMAIWIPDWSVDAASTRAGYSCDDPVAIVRADSVVAASSTARSRGVYSGLRLREAQYRCPDLIPLPQDDAAEARDFAPVLDVIEDAVPHVQVVRSGLVLARARGPARYYGSEQAAVASLCGALESTGVRAPRVCITDGPFAARVGVRMTDQLNPFHIVEPGMTARMLAGCSLDVLQEPELEALLARLGIETLGQFAALDEELVAGRFGEGGRAAWRRASGAETESILPRVIPRDWTRTCSFDPAAERADEITFRIRVDAERIVMGLLDAGQVMTVLRIVLVTEAGVSEQSWRHPRWFKPADVVDRVRWQLEGAGGAELSAAVKELRLIPERMDAAHEHHRGLWGAQGIERVAGGFARVQSILGHDGVLTPYLSGGQSVAERVLLVPWGEAPSDDATRLRARRERPWPGMPGGPSPSRVWRTGPSARVEARDGRDVQVEQEQLTTEPHEIHIARTRETIAGWAGPWPVGVRWWEGQPLYYRLQVLTDSGNAYLLAGGQQWRVEALYD